jgi:hypothetical protein
MEDPDRNVLQTRCELDPTSVPAAFTAQADAPCAVSSVCAVGGYPATEKACLIH